MKGITAENINRTLIISIITVVAFILAMVGITYAFFAISVTGNENASSIVINVADLGIVTFLDGNVINEENIYPMQQNERISKTFTITSEGNTVDIDYTVYFTITANTFIQQFENEFTYTLDGVSTNSGTVTTGVNEEVPIPGTYAIGTGILSANGDVHTYTFTIGLNEMNSNQDSNQGKTFAGSLSVESKKYTHDRSVWGE